MVNSSEIVEKIMTDDKSWYDIVIAFLESRKNRFNHVILDNADTLDNIIVDTAEDFYMNVKSKSFDPSRDWKGYVFKILENKIAFSHKKSKDTISITQVYPSTGLILVVDNFIDKQINFNEKSLNLILTKREKEVFKLAISEGLTIGEISNILKIEKQSVSTLKLSARRKVKEWMNSNDIDDLFQEFKNYPGE